DVAVFGDADVNADARGVYVLPVKSRIGHGLVRAVNADASGPGAAANFLLFLVTQFVVAANARQRVADVTNLVGAHPGAPGEQTLSKFGQTVAVRRGKA